MPDCKLRPDYLIARFASQLLCRFLCQTTLPVILCQKPLSVISMIFVSLFWTSGFSCAQSTPVTFDRVLELLKLEVKEDKLLALLKEQPTVFTLSDDQVAQLKRAGATDALLTMMQSSAKSVIQSDVGGYVMILDVSVSMLENTSDGQSKWEAAKKSATELIASVPDGLSLAVVVYGHEKSKPCEVEVLRSLMPINGNDKAEVTRRIQQLQPSGNTPIGRSLQVAAEQVYKSRTPAKILLITDGIETCKGDPLTEASKFAASEATGRSIDVIGFGLKPEEIQSVSKIAANGKGKYFDAKNSQELKVAFEQAKQDLLQKLTKTDGAVKLAASKVLNKPSELMVDTYTNARLAPGNYHYWQVNFQPGKYVVVCDFRSPENRYITIEAGAKLGVERDGEFVAEQSSGFLDHGLRGRVVMEVEFSSPTTKIIEINVDKSNQSLHDYHLGVFKQGTKFGVPFLVNSPEVKELEFGKEVTSPQLGGTNVFLLDNVVYYKVKLPAGDILVDVQWTGGNGVDEVAASPRHAWVCDTYGVYKSKLVGAQSEKQAKVKLLTAEEQEVILAFYAASRNEKITVKVTQVDN